MSIGLDQLYINMIAGRLERFSWVRDRLACCRCPMCGDSQRKNNKRRFYVYQDTKHGANHLSVSCHNCSYGNPVSRFLEEFAPDIYPEYRMELFKENGWGRPEPRKKVEIGKSVPDFNRKRAEVDETPTALVGERIGIELSDLDAIHPIKDYLRFRKIEEAQWPRLAYTPNFGKTIKEWLGEDFPYEEGSLPEDARLLIPFRDEWGRLTCVQGRAMTSGGIRYISIKKDTSQQKVFGLDKLNKSKTILVVEGPIDSLFLPNCLATADGNLMSVPFGDIYIPDNQPRNRQVVRGMEKIIEAGKKIVLFPPSLPWKDLNDMIQKGGMSKRELMHLVSSNIYQGLSAKAALARYRKI